ncbi:MAG: hypothetical protein L6Q78_14490 [Bacteroidia bacterium]|nr:hypothetical protein [Bacteroidia bacterium]
MKLVLLLIGFMTMSGCSGNGPHDNRLELLGSFIAEVKGSTNDKNQEIINTYFSLNSANNKEKIRSEYLNLIRSKLIDDFEILPYSKAADNFTEVHLIQDTANKGDIFIVKISKEPDYVYMKMNKDKIESVSPIIKGNVIVGWF